MKATPGEGILVKRLPGSFGMTGVLSRVAVLLLEIDGYLCGSAQRALVLRVPTSPLRRKFCFGAFCRRFFTVQLELLRKI